MLSINDHDKNGKNLAGQVRIISEPVPVVGPLVCGGLGTEDTFVAERTVCENTIKETDFLANHNIATPDLEYYKAMLIKARKQLKKARSVKPNPVAIKPAKNSIDPMFAPPPLTDKQLLIKARAQAEHIRYLVSLLKDKDEKAAPNPKQANNSNQYLIPIVAFQCGISIATVLFALFT